MNIKEIKKTDDVFKVGDRIVLCVCSKDCGKLGTVVDVSDHLVTWLLDRSTVPTSCLPSHSQHLLAKSASR